MKKFFFSWVCAIGILPAFSQWTISGANIYNNNTGNVGIGNTAPVQKLSLSNGNMLFDNANLGNTGNLYFGGQTDAGQNGLRLFGGNVNGGGITGGFIDVRSSIATDGLRIRVDGDAGGLERMRIAANGNVTIGAGLNTPAGYRLFVETGILTEKLKVAIKNTANWADHVFQPGYRLRPLSEVAGFIQQNKHLPGMPSANTMVRKGLDVAVMDAKLLEKIEELTLYVIELDKKVAKLTAENKAQETLIKQLQQQ